MRAIIGTFLVLIILAVGAAAGFAYSGAYDIGADVHHWGATYWVLERVRDRSVAAHASGIQVPADLGSKKRIVAGTSHFHAHCAICHGGPGVKPEDLAEGMYPKPPDLEHSSKHLSPAELFWVVKHGIKMSGMPSWADHGDDELWNVVAFLEKLPGMTPGQYQVLVKASAAAGGHHMHSGEPMDGMNMPGSSAAAVMSSIPKQPDD